MKGAKLNVMKTYGMYVAGVAFIFGFVAGWIVKGEHWDGFLAAYIPSLAVLAASFYGAKFAYQFQSDKEKEDKKNRNIVSGNNSIFALIRMANKLVLLQKQLINPTRNNPGRMLAMPALGIQEKDDIKLNLESLYFLLETDDRNLLGEIMVEEDRYRAAMDAINMRSRLHLQDIQPQLERAGFVNGGQYSNAEIQAMLGERLFCAITQATEAVIKHIDDAIVCHKVVADNLTNCLIKQYPQTRLKIMVLWTFLWVKGTLSRRFSQGGVRWKAKICTDICWGLMNHGQ